MAWLTVEVVIIVWNYIITGAIMLIAKSRKPTAEIMAESLSIEALEAIVAKKRRKARKDPEAKAE